MVEFALVLPILLIVVVGILEFGGYFKDVLTASHAVREGVRSLAVAGDDPTADCDGLRAAVGAFSSALNLADLDQIDIYKALSDGNQNLAETNTYQYDGSGDPLDCSNWTPDPLGVVPYPPGDRNVYADAELDLVGMRIVYTHSYYSGMPPFTGDVSIDSHVISRVEPDGLTP